MKTAILTLTPGGLELARRYRSARPEDLAIFAPGALFGRSEGPPGPIEGTFESDEQGVFGWDGPLRSLVPGAWARYDAIVAVMALGIVVRLFGPLAIDKRRDPAIVAVDDAGRFSIAVLGGHEGGANRLAEEVALILGTRAVVTTASDASGLPPVDLIGSDRGWIIERAENLTRVAAAVVRRQRVAVWQDAGSPDWWRRFGDWPDHFTRVDSLEVVRALDPSALLFISDRAVPEGLSADRTLIYRPPTLVAGVGCKRGTPRSTIDAWVETIFDRYGLSTHSLAALATVILKVDEPGLIEFARSRGVPLVAFPAEQLADHPGIETPSEQVRSRIGLVAVAEPAALRASGASRLLVSKQKGPGVTLALARIPTDS
jgi:cobalt-precorrin 5A hydrolase